MLKPKISRKGQFQIMLLPKVVLIFHVNRRKGPTAVVNALLSVLRFSFDRIVLIMYVIIFFLLSLPVDQAILTVIDEAMLASPCKVSKIILKVEMA